MNNKLANLSVSTRLLVSAALQRGINIKLLSSSKNTFLVRIGDTEHIWKETSFGNPVALFHICKNKMATHDLLRLWGYNVPNACVFGVEEKEEAFMWGNQYRNVVFKPLDAAHGDDITVLPQGINEMEDAWYRVINGKKQREKVLIEEYIGGEDYRILVVGNACVYVIHRIPAMIVGDGELSVQQLINRENKRPSRGKKRYGSYYSPITVDNLLNKNLLESGLTLDSIPGRGERVFLRKVCNVGRGGTEIDVTPYISTQLVDEAVALTNRLGMDILAIDIRCDDVFSETSLFDIKILELNATPGITLGAARWVADAIWDALLEKYDSTLCY